MTELERPLPITNEANAPYWASARARKLQLPRCEECHSFFYPLTLRCRACLSGNVAWTAVSGDASLVTWNVMHQIYDKSFAELAPYIVGVVKLAEGPQMVTSIVGTDAANLRAGLPVKLEYLEVTSEITLPVYRPLSI